MSPNSTLLVLKLVDLLALGSQLAPEIRERYDEAAHKIRQLVEQGRDPTPEEWAELDAQTDAFMESIGS